MRKGGEKEMRHKAMIFLTVLVLALSLAVVCYAEGDVDFSAVITTILGYLTAAFTAVATLLALIYGAPLAWRFIKRFK
jgi:hypothetical protein